MNPISPDDVINFATKFGVSASTAKAMIESASGGGYGNADQNSGNVRMVQGQTSYDPSSYVETVGKYGEDAAQKAFGLSTTSKMIDQYINNADRQAAFTNKTANDDQRYRAEAANNILNAYNNARTANQQFLANINNVGRSVSAF